jgi:soluble lytic murein transglycosylase-like protein
MTTLILSPVVALTLVSASQPVATQKPAAAGAQPVANVAVRVPTAIISERRAIETPTPAPPTVAARPRPAPPRAAPVAAGPPADPNSVIGIIEAAAARWGVSGSWMVKIARCESGLRPNAYNPRGPYIGLFQFLQSTFTHNGGTNIYDAADQANVAAKMLAHGQAHQWSCA